MRKPGPTRGREIPVFHRPLFLTVWCNLLTASLEVASVEPSLFIFPLIPLGCLETLFSQALSLGLSPPLSLFAAADILEKCWQNVQARACPECYPPSLSRAPNSTQAPGISLSEAVSPLRDGQATL